MEKMDNSITITEEEIKRYYELNNQKKQIDEEMKHLKKLFHQAIDDTAGKEQKGEIQRGNYKVQRQIRKSINYHDESTVEKLAELNLEEFIIIAKRPDTEKLESAINLGFVKEDEFKDCKKTKIMQTITVKQTFSK